MKATGIVRRIDDLGRVVIPKEIRHNQHLREGDPLELYLGEEGEIILKRYEPMSVSRQFEDFKDELKALIGAKEFSYLSVELRMIAQRIQDAEKNA